MKKLMNAAKDFVPEYLEGIELAYGDRVRIIGEDRRVRVRAGQGKAGRVAVVTAGGSGHLPVFMGYVGEGMLDGCAVGNVFASPSSENMLHMIKAVNQGAGVLCLYGNYGGDKMNFHMAEELAEFEEIATAEVLVCDDAASRPKEEKEMRRGVAGMVYAFKIAGAAADQGRSLEEVAAVTRRALDNIRTIGVALSPCIVPEVGRETFTIAPDEMELGMGIHGEPGIQVCKMMSADEAAGVMMDRLEEDLPLAPDSEVSVMVNGLGATPLEELLIVYRAVCRRLRRKGVQVFMPHIGEFATSMEMAGCSITVFRLDPELKALLRMPASTPFYTNHNK